ncbi:hypothetical protein GW17_00026216 [Ensete ventricosum]|nr:hypothetical protein GW17_00026216 [Ensete ventricosum]
MHGCCLHGGRLCQPLPMGSTTLMGIVASIRNHCLCAHHLYVQVVVWAVGAYATDASASIAYAVFASIRPLSPRCVLLLARGHDTRLPVQGCCYVIGRRVNRPYPGVRAVELPSYNQIMSQDQAWASGWVWTMQWDLTEIRNEIRRRDWEVRWEHARRSPEEDRKTRCKNARGCRIDGSKSLVSDECTAAAQAFERLTRPG